MAGDRQSKTDFDVVVVGGGPGGYVAAIRAGQLGLRTACIEADKLGGVCLNIGCIPTKALLSSALMVNELRDAGGHGITFDGFTADLGPAQKRSRSVAAKLSNGVSFLLRKNKVAHIEGYGRLLGGGRVEVDNNGEKQVISARDIIIATGSRPRSLPFLQIDEERIWSSTGALFQDEAPETLVVVGAGAVGMEFADIYNAYGTKVTVIEALDRVLPLEDKDSSRTVAMAFKKRKMDIFTSARVESTEVVDDGVVISFTDKRGKAHRLEVDYVLSAVGRIPNTEDIGLEAAGVKVTERGNFVAVDEAMRTNVPGIWAVGDCAGQQLLAHKGMHEGVVAAEHIAGVGHHTVDYANVPNCTYCHPEVASVGLTEEQARENGLDIEVGKFPWAGNGRALAAGDSTGFVKVIRDKRYSEVVGAHIVGPHATELIAEFVMARHLESTVEEIDLAMHPHPTLSEAVAEGALGALGRPLHI
ncbi:MAG: dihydrolipoyl dehydrogenase [Gemmatimonadetes bacterium]|nr:dihydrolipoyl dehydrogenase [Gemmatimonadota bacterium]MXX72333.1 dihydrolipoyl dehydrogenase [Gemmatimonadota bacterium]MYC92463.1 dihydrolipoyl dehydrogenase [Gemmatimonadota bacterium]MYG34004.1 dihydrolipoyl dehydrogenase [Gemmatimonadota bacterium]MYJ17478.1 dihydrolipoyl dehydrogenase [Gemmatimonadota bacterium]